MGGGFRGKGGGSRGKGYYIGCLNSENYMDRIGTLFSK